MEKTLSTIPSTSVSWSLHIGTSIPIEAGLALVQIANKRAPNGSLLFSINELDFGNCGMILRTVPFSNIRAINGILVEHILSDLTALIRDSPSLTSLTLSGNTMNVDFLILLLRDGIASGSRLETLRLSRVLDLKDSGHKTLVDAFCICLVRPGLIKRHFTWVNLEESGFPIQPRIAGNRTLSRLDLSHNPWTTESLHRLMFLASYCPRIVELCLTPFDRVLATRVDLQIDGRRLQDILARNVVVQSVVFDFVTELPFQRRRFKSKLDTFRASIKSLKGSSNSLSPKSPSTPLYKVIIVSCLDMSSSKSTIKNLTS
jgi:hypothetical protein